MSEVPKQKRVKADRVSWNQARALLETPGCTQDIELSQKVHRPVYQLPNGTVLLPLQDDVGVLYQSREDLALLFEDTP